MRVRRSGIALILVLAAAASVFALAMQGAVSSRLGMVEAGATLARFEGGIRARSAATIVLAGLLSTHHGSVDDGENALTGADGRPESPSSEEPSIDLPPMIRRILEESGVDLEDAARDALEQETTQQAVDGGALGPRAPKRVDLTEVLSTGVPTTPVEVTIDGWRCRVMLADGAGGLNVNLADEATLLSYFGLIGVPAPTDRALASQILDWRDEDDFESERGAERATYARLNIAPRNARLRTLLELRYLPAMTPELFARMQDDLCLSSDGKAHLGSASPAVLQAVGKLNSSQVDRVLALRATGLLTDQSVGEFIDLDDDSGESMVRVATSTIIRIRVQVMPTVSDRGRESKESWATALEFEGAAIVRGGALREIGLKARTRPAPVQWPTMSTSPKGPDAP